MAIKTQFTVESDHLVATSRGEFTLEDLRLLIDAIAQAARESGRQAVLADLTAVSGAPTTIDRFQIGEWAAHRLAGLRVAAFGNSPFIEPGAFAAVVANNRGATLGVFLDESEAHRWLEADPNSAQDPRQEKERET